MKKQVPITTLACCALLLSMCQPQGYNMLYTNTDLCQFSQVALQDLCERTIIGESGTRVPIYVDPVLKYRPTFSPDFNIESKSSYSEHHLVFDEHLNAVCSLDLPVQGSKYCAYYQGTEPHLDSVYSFFYSPLLRTTHPDTFLMQEYSFFPFDGMRFSCHRVTKYVIKDDKPVPVHTVDISLFGRF